MSFRLAPGEFHALPGESGAGKSTLVKCIMGFYQPTRGNLMLDGVGQPVQSPAGARDVGIGMAHEHFTLVPCLIAAENMVISRGDVPAVIDWTRGREAP